MSRFYFNHRYSDDLDLFVNADERFSEHVEKVVDSIQDHQLKMSFSIMPQRSMKSEMHAQIFLTSHEIDAISLKIDFVNDIKTRYGELNRSGPIPIDSWQNILSNKLAALYRLEPKDVADIIFISRGKKFNWKEMMWQAQSKDSGVDPVTISEILVSFPVELASSIKWTQPIQTDSMMDELKIIAHDIIAGSENSLFVGHLPFNS